MLLFKAASLSLLIFSAPVAAPPPVSGPARPSASDIQPLIGQWRSISPPTPELIQPGDLTFTTEFIVSNGFSERIREVRRHENIFAIQTGIRAVHNFELIGPEEMCRVVIGRVDPNPIPISTPTGDPHKIRVGCFRKVRSGAA